MGSLCARYLDHLLKEVLDWLCGLIASIYRKPAEDGRLLDRSDAHVREIIGVNKRKPSSGFPIPRNLAARLGCLKHRSEQGGTLAVQHRGPDHDSLHAVVFEHRLFDGGTPRHERDGVQERSRVRDDLVCARTVHPGTGGVDEGNIG